MKYTAYTDGSCIPNPGKMKLGFIIFDINNKEISSQTVYLGNGTNNQAEYLSLINCLCNALQNNIKELHVYMDSLLVVNQVQDKFKVKDLELVELWENVKTLKSKFYQFTISYIPREQNKVADKLSRNLF